MTKTVKLLVLEFLSTLVCVLAITVVIIPLAYVAWLLFQLIGLNDVYDVLVVTGILITPTIILTMMIGRLTDTINSSLRKRIMNN